MKVMGLIGGMSWNSTLEYYRIINELFAQRLGGLHSARLILYSLDFDEIERAQREARWDDAAHILVEASTALKQAGADFLVICTNTMHRVADVVAEKSSLPLLHIVDVTGNAIRERGMNCIGLLGSRFVMKEAFYRERLQKQFAIEVLVPEEDDMVVVDRIIYDELCRGRTKAASRRTCADVISRLVGRGAEGIVLGCTELPLLVRSGDIAVPIFDTTRLHAEAAVNLALAEG
ncbi:MAG: aspartate/glutamate racemase family protein [Chloroflexi bacterium]|nr:aspartate/glutamate racemase family protein [Chloroflexota bacterium]